MKYLVTGAGGFIGGHLVKELLKNHQVIAVDIKPLDQWFQVHSTVNIPNIDLRNNVDSLPSDVDYVLNLACDHGGIGYLSNNNLRSLLDVTININMLNFVLKNSIPNYLFASTACVYNEHLQTNNSIDVYLKEADAWPAAPDMKYGLEKLYSEELCIEANIKHGLKVYIPRIHGCYGPYNHFNEIREKAPNAILRKVLMSDTSVEVWGDGNQRRSFMYVDDVVTGIIKLINSDYHRPINIGSDMTVSINSVVATAMNIVGKQLDVRHVPGALGVQSRSSDNSLIVEQLGWKPSITINQGFEKMLPWMREQILKL